MVALKTSKKMLIKVIAFGVYTRVIEFSKIFLKIKKRSVRLNRIKQKGTLAEPLVFTEPLLIKIVLRLFSHDLWT